MVDQTKDQTLIMLGEIRGIVAGLRDGQAAQGQRMDRQEAAMNKRMDVQDAALARVDDRLRTVEQKSAVIGAVSGGAVSVGVALIIEGLRQWVSRGTGH